MPKKIEEDQLEHRRMSPLMASVISGVMVGVISGVISGLANMQAIDTKVDAFYREMNQKWGAVSRDILHLSGKLEYVAEEQQRRTYYVYGRDGKIRKRPKKPIK